jgi:putative Ca2+/H+ antiporter (TMEM165/GDT1 family)
MGDKTQFLAISFAAKHNIYKVTLGIFLAIVANFALTIAFGQFLITIVPIDIISLAASLSFIGFGLWTVQGEKHKTEKEKISRFGIVGTVFLAFFIAEFGDKTELAAVSLVAQYQNAVSVFLGATIAMLAADGIGIVVGIVLCKRFPERLFNWLSAIIFVIFGLVGLYEVLPGMIGLSYTVLTLLVAIAVSILAMLVLVWRQRFSENSCRKQNLQRIATKQKIILP